MTTAPDRAFARLQAHTAIATFAQGAGGLFVFIYMMRAGVAAPLVFCAIAGMSAGRFVLRPLVLPLARRFGVKRLLILGVAVQAMVYPMLTHLHGAGVWLVLVIAVGAVGGVFYWTCYHVYYAALGDEDARGAQLGARQAIMAVVGVVAPVIGGFAIARAGALVAFWVVAAIEAAGILPLLGAPDIAIAEVPEGGRADYLRGAVLQSTDGFMDAGFFYVWQIGLFLTLGEHYEGYGGAMAVAGLAGAAASMVIGRLIDLGHGRISTVFAYGLTGGAIVAQAASLGRPAWAVVANAVAAFAIALFAPTMMTRVYALSKASPCPLRFQIATEGGWDVGAVLGCLLCAAVVAGGFGLSAAILTALAGASGAAILLARGYGARAA